jgi:hypothetical protein
MGSGAVAALCLRTPDNAAAFVANGIAQLLVDILKLHTLKVGVEVKKKTKQTKDREKERKLMR